MHITRGSSVVRVAIKPQQVPLEGQGAAPGV